MQSTETDHPFAPVVKMWHQALKTAGKDRWNKFGKTASVCRKFFDGAHDFMYESKRTDGLGMVVGEGVAKPSFPMSVNKIAELVQIFGPTIYHANPYRHVKPRKPPLNEQQLALRYGPAAGTVLQMLGEERMRDETVASLMSCWLNYLPGQLDLKAESRLAADEALITGMGVVWHEMYRPGPNAPGFLPYSYQGSPDDLFLDPDAEKWNELTWCAQRTQIPRWQAEREYGLRDGALKKYARGETSMRSASVDSSEMGIYRRKQGRTADVVTIYKVWSKSGLGHELSAPTNDEVTLGEEASVLRESLSRFGDQVFLVLCEDCPWPLNIPPEEMRADGEQYSEREVWERTRWPVPFYEDSDGWPFTPLCFQPVSKCLWPMAHFKPALGEMMALNWIYSFLMGRVHFTSRVLLFYAEHVSDEVRKALESGKDLELIPYQEALINDVNKVVQQFEHKASHIDLWKLASELNVLIDKRTGLSEIMYGMVAQQMRSATEAQVRQNATNVRPAAMADAVDDFATKIARKESLMSQWKVDGRTVSAFMGEFNGMDGMGTFGQLWQQFCYVPLNYLDPMSLMRPPLEYEVTIAAGSARKPDIAKDQTDMDQASQMFVPIFDREYQMTGDPTLLNSFMQKWADSRQMDLPMMPDRTAQIAAQQQAAMQQQAPQQPVDEFGNPVAA